MKTALFIDGPNLYATAKVLGLEVDFKKLLGNYPDLIRAYYYTATLEDQPDGYQSIRPLIDWLSYNGFLLVSKPAKQFTDPLTGRVKTKGNMDIEIAVDMLEIAPFVERIVLFSGDGDFKSLLSAVQRRGVRCEVVSSIKTSPPMCADELRRQCDAFTDLTDMQYLTKGASIPRSRYSSNG